MTYPSDGQLGFASDRMWLRSLADSDEALFCSLYCDPEVMQFVGPPLSRGAAIRWFRAILARAPLESGQPLVLAMVGRPGGRPLGLCGVTCWAPDARQMEAGILLLREARARGFAREGMAALLRWLFETTIVEEIRVEFSAECQAVRRLNESIGFVPCAAGEGRAGSGRLVWSVGRSSWCNDGQTGEGSDGRNRLSGDAGYGRQRT